MVLQGLTIMDKIELLKTVGFHVHVADGASEWRGVHQTSSLAASWCPSHQGLICHTYGARWVSEHTVLCATPLFVFLC
jgi:hypothetical protein